jgi:Kef-type K+ transport system membrane component KefB
LQQVVVILGTTRALVNILKPLKQPAVIAEIIGGIVLGPSILGQIPGFSVAIVPAASLPLLQLFANVGCGDAAEPASVVSLL